MINNIESALLLPTALFSQQERCHQGQSEKIFMNLWLCCQTAQLFSRCRKGLFVTMAAAEARERETIQKLITDCLSFRLAQLSLFPKNMHTGVRKTLSINYIIMHEIPQILGYGSKVYLVVLSYASSDSK